MGETISRETRTARKPHVCAYCHAQIAKGEKYRAWTWRDLGRLFSERAHNACVSAGGSIYYPGDSIGDWEEFREECEARWPDERFPWTLNPPSPATPPAPSP
jgi:hypothetical protein